MALHGAEADEEGACDLRVTASVCDHAEDLGFARGQRRVLGERGPPRSDPAHRNVGDVRIEIRAPFGCGPNRGDDALGRRGLQRVGVGSGRERREDLAFEVVHGENRHARCRRLDAYAARQFDAVDSGKSDVDDGDVGAVFENRGQAAWAVAGLGDDLQVAGTIERGAQTGTRQRVVLNEHDRLHTGTRAGASGNESVKMLPPSGRGAYATLPPWLSAIRRTR